MSVITCSGSSEEPKPFTLQKHL